MASRIQGITVEIGGDTTKLSSALSGVNKEIKNTQSQLKDVEKLLKLDPTNTELLAQKQRLLGDREEGSAGSVTRIKWTITYDGNEFSGGITNSGWYRSGEIPGYDNGPFQNATDEEIYREASTVGNLDSFFNNWNNSVSPRDILGFQMAIYDYNDACITIGGMGS